MGIKSLVLSVFEKNRLLSALLVSLTNKIHIGSNKLSVTSNHFKNNTLNFNGSGSCFTLKDNSFLRDCIVNIDGCENEITVDENTEIYDSNRQMIHIDGNNNKIVIGKKCRIRDTSFFFRGNDNLIYIDDDCSLCGTELHIEQDNNELKILKGTSMHGRDGHYIHIALDESSRIIIGEDCMLSNGIQMRSSDSHSIVDLNRKRLNNAEDIIIGKHCWISMGAIILKGTHIADHTVVAAGAVCTKKYDTENCILAGNPAKVVKQDIDWDRKFL